MKSRWRTKKKRKKNSATSKANAGGEVTRRDKIRACKCLSNDFHPQSVRPNFHVYATRQEKTCENWITRKIREPVRLSIPARFSQLAAVRCEMSRFPGIRKYCVYAYTNIYAPSVLHVGTVSRRELWKVCELEFSKISLVVAEFRTLCAENIGLNLHWVSVRNWIASIKLACGEIL